MCNIDKIKMCCKLIQSNKTVEKNVNFISKMFIIKWV